MLGYCVWLWRLCMGSINCGNIINCAFTNRQLFIKYDSFLICGSKVFEEVVLFSNMDKHLYYQISALALSIK